MILLQSIIIAALVAYIGIEHDPGNPKNQRFHKNDDILDQNHKKALDAI